MFDWKRDKNMTRPLYEFLSDYFEQDVVTDFKVSQNAIPSKKYLGGHLPYVFTEYGVLMLANVLKSERAIKMRSG